MNTRPYTSQQMGDAGEMLVVSELTLAGVPAMKMPDNWPCYDVIAQKKDIAAPQRISVKSRTFKRGADAYVEYKESDDSFDWLAIVLLSCPGEKERQFFIIPKAKANGIFQPGGSATKNRGWMHLQVDKMAEKLSDFEGNFCLSATGKVRSN